MRIIVSDSSCLIDLRKATLLNAFMKLPYEVLIPNTLFEDELLKFTSSQKRALVRAGLEVVDLPGEAVLRAQRVIRETPRLSIHDGFAFVLAQDHPGCILLTGDGDLRALATNYEIEVHGLLWVIDEMHRHRVRTARVLLRALRVLENDPAVRLPRNDLAARIKRFEREQ